MESKASGLVFCKAEEKDFIPLVELMSKVLRDGDSLHADKFNLQKWKWKYFELANAAPQIYLCKENEQILGYYHCPIYCCTIAGVPKKIAMVQDVGVSEAARGKGVFKKLADYATHQLLASDIALIYTFPNGNSIHTFLKYNGYTKIETFCTFVLPIKTEEIIASKIRFLNIHKLVGVLSDLFFSFKLPRINLNYKIISEEKLSEEMVQLFHQFNTSFKNSLTRDYNYLNWRFEKKPHGKTYFFTARKESKLVAVAIISIEDLLGSKAAVVLDFACDTKESFSQLVASVRKNTEGFFGQKLGMFYTSVSGTNAKLFSAAGFTKIPEKLNPRALHLLGKNVNGNEREVLNPENWNFTLSDWDVL